MKLTVLFIMFLYLYCVRAYAFSMPQCEGIGQAQGYDDILGIICTNPVPTLATVGTSGIYSDLISKPTIPVVQSYDGTTQRLGSFSIFKTGTTAGGGGQIAFNITNDATSGGASLCPNGVIKNSLNAIVNDSSAIYPMNWAWSNSDKTVTVTVFKTASISLLSTLLSTPPAAAPNGTAATMTVSCY